MRVFSYWGVCHTPPLDRQIPVKILPCPKLGIAGGEKEIDSYKNNYRSEGIRIANARIKVIIFCKSRPLN